MDTISASAPAFVDDSLDSDSLALKMRSHSETSYSSDDDFEEAGEETALLSDKRRAYQSLRSASVQQRVKLTWENLRVTAPSDKRKFFSKKDTDRANRRNQILRNVSGSVESGQLLAVMGASGGGKTTLMNTLTARNLGNFIVEGSVHVNGDELGRNITAVSAYVQQDDLFVGTLTVREHLTFQALLRLPKRLSREQKMTRVEEVIFELGLKKCANTRIGIPGVMKGISGGESKRLAFASEVLRNPPILFCDEPTTGLDSFMAQSVVRVLQRLAAGGKAILCTIHQPTSDVYMMFDRVMFLAEGRVAYTGKTLDALEFFADEGYQCPDDYNPADFVVHTLAVVPGKEVECRERVERICDGFEQYQFQEPSGVQSITASVLELADMSKKSPYNANWLVQFWVILWRSLLFGFRHRGFVFAKVLQKMLLGLFLGLMYLNNKMNQVGIMNYNGALFFVLAEIAFPAVFGLLSMMPNEFPLLVREHHNGMYKVSSFYVAKMIAFIPTFSIDAILFVCISYFMIGFRQTADGIFIMLGLCIMIAQCSCAFASFLSALSPTFELAVAIAGPALALLQMAGGLYANIATIPSYISWLQYFSWFRFGFEALAINQWHQIKNITCETVDGTCLKTGDDVLGQLSFSPSGMNNDLIFMAGIFAGFHILGYLALWWRVYRAR